MVAQTGFLLPAANVLQPYRQGHASSLCGLYALLNAIQLVMWPDHKLTGRQVKKLFLSGVQRLDQSRGLASVLGRGIDEDAWLDLSRTLIKQANAMTGLSISRRFILRLHCNLTGRSAISVIKQQLRDNGRRAHARRQPLNRHPIMGQEMPGFADVTHAEPSTR